MHFVLYGNCQISSIAASLRFHRPDDNVSAIHLPRHATSEQLARLRELVMRADVVISQPQDGSVAEGAAALTLPEKTLRVQIPTIVFPGFHPDQSYLCRKDNSFLGPLGPYSSRLTVFGVLRGLAPDQTLALFRPEVYEALDWDFGKALSAFTAFMKQSGIDPSPFLGDWLNHGCFMHTINHPKLRVVSDVTAAALRQAGLEAASGNCADYLADPLAWHIWPVLPGLRVTARNVAGAPVFLLSPAGRGARQPQFITLEGYVQRVYAALAGLRDTDLHDASAAELDAIDAALAPMIGDLRGGKPRNPYRGLPDHQFWRRGISAVPPEAINPMVNAPFKVAPGDRIATAGSCFAQHIAKRLARSGYNYYVAEQPPAGMSKAEANAKSYGVYSARYANVYTARQLLQLFQRAFGAFKPANTCWPTLNRGFVDPFRPEIEPESVLPAEAVLESAQVHLAAVREMFRGLDVFVFTLGLTEAWQDRKDGAVYPLAPGVVSSLTGAGVEFVNFGFDEVRADLFAFIEALRVVNPAARVILTVSPVPLIATYESRHVLTSTVASKSILRAAADEASRKLGDVMYFPSYEIITMAAAKGGYFEADLRSVKTAGVDHVMRCFFESCASNARPARKAKVSGQSSAALSELQELAQIICDEEQIVAGL